MTETEAIHAIAQARDAQRKAFVAKLVALTRRYKADAKYAEARGANRAMLLIRRKD
jgi:hypothetical protein